MTNTVYVSFYYFRQLAAFPMVQHLHIDSVQQFGAIVLFFTDFPRGSSSQALEIWPLTHDDCRKIFLGNILQSGHNQAIAIQSQARQQTKLVGSPPSGPSAPHSTRLSTKPFHLVNVEPSTLGLANKPTTRPHF
jgi:hypothetical protein